MPKAIQAKSFRWPRSKIEVCIHWRRHRRRRIQKECRRMTQHRKFGKWKSATNWTIKLFFLFWQHLISDLMNDQNIRRAFPNVNEPLILSNMLLYLFLFRRRRFRWFPFVCLYFLCETPWLYVFIFSLFEFFVHAAVTSQTQKHRRLVYTSRKFGNILHNSLTFLVMRTNECQKEESALTAPNQRKQKKSHPKRTTKKKIQIKN